MSRTCLLTAYNQNKKIIQKKYSLVDGVAGDLYDYRNSRADMKSCSYVQ